MSLLYRLGDRALWNVNIIDKKNSVINAITLAEDVSTEILVASLDRAGSEPN